MSKIKGILALVKDVDIVVDDKTTVIPVPELSCAKSAKPVDINISTAPQQASSDYYWNSYAHFGIHEEMLKDEVRTRSYYEAIVNNPLLFEDKIVLDVGCGTGIMSLFSVKAGAKHVYAIDNSGIIEQAKQIAIDNGMDDKITFIRGRAEDIELPVEKVDIIISEWMGYFLFYESMLETIIYARDKWLAKDGYLLPDRASISICGIEDEDYKGDRINWWDRVWGIDMSSIKKYTLVEPFVDYCDERCVVTDHCAMMSIDLYSITKEELDWTIPFKLKATRTDHCHGLVVYFDIWFTSSANVVHFSTGPHAPYTHWKQTVFYLNDILMVSENDEIKGTISEKRNSRNPRDLDIDIHYVYKGKYNDCNVKQSYFLR